MKVSFKRGRSYLFKLFKGRVTHLFQNFLMRLDKLPKKTGRILSKGGLEKRVLSPFGSGIHPSETCFQMLLLGWLVFLLIICCLCGLGIRALSICRDALWCTHNNHEVLHHLSQTPRIQYINTFPD